LVRDRQPVSRNLQRVGNPSEVSRSAELVTESNNPEIYVQQKASLQITWSGGTSSRWGQRCLGTFAEDALEGPAS
jgi:hypothetical protein